MYRIEDGKLIIASPIEDSSSGKIYVKELDVEIEFVPVRKLNHARERL